MGGSLITREALRQSLGNISREMPRVATGGIDFLKMDKGGDWSYGQDDEDVNGASIWAINPATLQHGWIAWAEQLGQEPLGEVMVSAMKPLPDAGSLKPITEGKGYQPQYSVELICISGPNEGAHVLYKKESVGAIKLFNVYIDELMTRVDAESDHLVALVRITSQSYDHKKYKKTYNPVFEYVEWREPDDVSAPEAAPEPAAKTKQSSKPKAAPQAAPVTAPVEEQDEPEDDDEEDDDDRAIRELLEKKAAKKAAAEAAADEPEEPAEDTPRRRVRR